MNIYICAENKYIHIFFLLFAYGSVTSFACLRASLFNFFITRRLQMCLACNVPFWKPHSLLGPKSTILTQLMVFGGRCLEKSCGIGRNEWEFDLYLLYYPRRTLVVNLFFAEAAKAVSK